MMQEGKRPPCCRSHDLTGSECGGCTLTQCLRYTKIHHGVTYERMIAEFGVPAHLVKPGETYTVEERL